MSNFQEIKYQELETSLLNKTGWGRESGLLNLLKEEMNIRANTGSLSSWKEGPLGQRDGTLSIFPTADHQDP